MTAIQSDAFGELFEQGAPPYRLGDQVQDVLLLPGVPLYGKAPADAILAGVIDSGVSASHPQVAGYLRASADFAGSGPEDTLGHGTVVALRLLFGMGDTSPPMAIVSAKVTDREGRIREQSVVRAIDWVAEQGVKVVNMSFGFRGSCEEFPALCAAIARHPEIVFCAAAGNYGPDVKVVPAACPCVLSVGATDAQGAVAAYSGTAHTYAPGQALLQKEWSYRYDSGQELARAGRSQEARLEYELSLAARPNAQSEFQLGVLDLTEGQPASALARLRRGIELAPNFAEAHEMLGAALCIVGDYPAAEQALRRALLLYADAPDTLPSRARAHFNLGQALHALGRTAEALSELEVVAMLVPDYPRLADRLRELRQTQQ